MFTLKSRAQLTQAVDRARALHPKVRMVSFGEYAVTGSKGSAYTVRCYRSHGQKIVDCSCKTRNSVACKHAAAALSLHVALAKRRAH